MDEGTEIWKGTTFYFYLFDSPFFSIVFFGKSSIGATCFLARSPMEGVTFLHNILFKIKLRKPTLKNKTKTNKNIFLKGDTFLTGRLGALVLGRSGQGK